jgi:tetratricopeptide (TPR) repeat protein
MLSLSLSKITLWPNALHTANEAFSRGHNRGLAYWNKGDLDKALLRHSRGAVQPNTLDTRGWIHIAKGEPDLALADLDKALSLDPNRNAIDRGASARKNDSTKIKKAEPIRISNDVMLATSDPQSSRLTSPCEQRRGFGLFMFTLRDSLARSAASTVTSIGTLQAK